MRKYFTWRCIGLHAVALVLVPTFLFLGRWQYHAALRGNDLSWVYTVEWPVFAIYALYVWWKLIHEKPTPFDRLWAVRERAAAEATGTPLQQIPGWALDKSLARAVAQASVEYPVAPAPALARAGSPLALAPPPTAPPPVADRPSGDPSSQVIDARVVRVEVDEEDPELTAYNRYLAELNRIDPPKQW